MCRFNLGEVVEELDGILLLVDTIDEALPFCKPDSVEFGQALTLRAKASERATAIAGELVLALGGVFKGNSLPPPLPLAEAAAVHGGFRGVVRLLGSDANVVHGGFADALQLYTKSVRDRLFVEQDSQLCNVIAQRAEESAQWRCRLATNRTQEKV